MALWSRVENSNVHLFISVRDLARILLSNIQTFLNRHNLIVKIYTTQQNAYN